MTPLVNKKFKLEKFHGKGGWTYVRLPATLKASKKQFGWSKVRGTIDGYEISQYHLMPMGDGKMFLPVKGEIRKQIKKEEGDMVHIILYPDKKSLEIPEELLMCLEDDTKALTFFNTLSESEKKYYVQWIYSAKREETKVDRMAKCINKLVKGLKMYEKE